MKESDSRGTVGVVFDVGDLGGNPVLVPLEVDDPILTLVASATVVGGDAAIIVATTGLLERLEKTFLGLLAGDFLSVQDGTTPTTGRGGGVELDSHDAESPLDEVDLLPLLQLHDRNLSVRVLVDMTPASADLAPANHGAHLFDFDVEDMLNGLADFNAIRRVGDLETVGARPFRFGSGLLGEKRLQENLVGRMAHALAPTRSRITSRAPSWARIHLEARRS